MTRSVGVVLEFIVAVIIVIIAALILGVFLPSSGHIERSTTVSGDIRHVYDIFANFRRFPDYSIMTAEAPQIEYNQSADNWYGPGASISWTSNNKHVGDGNLTIVSAKPGFNKIELTGKGTIVWSLKNGWHGGNKQYVIHLKRTGRAERLVKINWAYNVHYGWNLINRYAGLYIHGAPDKAILYNLDQLENALATIPNISYAGLDPHIVSTPQQPVLVVQTSAKRNLTDVDDATATAVNEIDATMKKLGLHQTGPRFRFTTQYGAETYQFAVAIPVSSDTVTIKGKQYTLRAPHPPGLGPNAANAASTANASSVAGAGSVATASSVANASSAASTSTVASASSAAPASAASAGKAGAAPAGPQPGSLDLHGRLIINAHVRGMLAFGGKALEAVWYGSPAGIPPTRLRLKAYAETHGYPFDAVNHRLYDKQVLAYQSKRPNGKTVAYDEQTFKVYLPLLAAPPHTPEQAAGMKPSNPFFTIAPASSAPANGSSAPAPASSAPAHAASATSKSSAGG